MRTLLTLLLILAIPINAAFAAGERLCDELERFGGHATHAGHHAAHHPSHPSATLSGTPDMPADATTQLAEQTTLAVMSLADHDHPIPGSKACYDHCHAHAHGSTGWLMPSQLQLPQAPQQLRLAGGNDDAFSSIQVIPPERPPRSLPLIHTA